jgi:signal transduction histidine kinase
MLATELHDDLGQSLTSLKLMLEFSASKHATHKQQEVMRNARELLVELMDKVRNLSLDLRPAMLDDFGLFATLRWLFERFHTQTGISIRCNYNLDSAQRFPAPVEIGAFRIIQEALTNIARHAAVKEAQVNIEIDKNLAIEIADHGTGFDFSGDINQLASSGGLSGMQERARLLGGKVLIFSKKGAGTRVVAEIPLAGGTL